MQTSGIFGGIFNQPSYSYSGQTTVAKSAFGGLFFLSLAVFVIFLVLTFINYTLYPIFSFSVNDSALITIPTASDREYSYSTTTAVPNLRRDQDRGGTTTPSQLPAGCTYTIGADIFIDGGLTPIRYPNVILYRDLSNNTATLTRSVTATRTSLNTSYPNSNIILWLDNATTDLMLSLVTLDNLGGDVLNTYTVIKNVPLQKTFRLVMIVTDSFVEIYKNGQMETTVTMEGSIKVFGSSTSSTDFYPPVAGAGTGGITLANMSMWPRVLTSKEVRAFEATPIRSP